MKASMAIENEIVQNIRIRLNITLETMALRTMHSVSAISRYENGQATVPVGYLRAIYNMFTANGLDGDWVKRCMLLQLIAPDLAPNFSDPPAPMSATPQRTPPAGEPRQLISDMLDVLGRLTGVAKLVHRIVDDGRVDPRDDPAIASLMEEGNAVTATINKTVASVQAWRDNAERPRQR